LDQFRCAAKHFTGDFYSAASAGLPRSFSSFADVASTLEQVLGCQPVFIQVHCALTWLHYTTLMVYMYFVNSVYKAYSFSAFFPVKFCHRSTITSTYAGSNSIAKQILLVISHDIIMLPEPAYGSKTMVPSLE